MAKFLDTTGVSYYLQQIINHAQDSLILISPYLKINERLKESLEDKDRMKIVIRIVYGKSELLPDQMKWLQSLKFVRLSFCENLHAKCYLNEGEAIITSMNLYAFSQVNNQEMGVYFTRTDDPQLYNDTWSEARRLIRLGNEIQRSTDKVCEEKPVYKKNGKTGFCIRCKKEISFNSEAPYCKECYKSWVIYENPSYREKHCHLCGESYNSTLIKPLCYQCFKQKE